MKLTINRGSFNSYTITSCDSYSWNGTIYNSSGNYTYNYFNNNGCASVDTLHLTIKSSTHNVYNISSCNSYDWNGNTYTTSGTYTFSYNNNGCVSVDTLKLIIHNGTHNNFNAISCGNYAWNGNNYTTSGNYIYAYIDEYGCLSSDTLHLTINQSTHNNSYVSACDSYSWNGNIYTSSGTYLFHYTNNNGCNSTDTLHLTINNTYNSIDAISCNSYLWHGINYTTSGVYVFNYINNLGCASADTLHLTINKSSSSNSVVNICATSLPYIWNGSSYSSAGYYTKTLVNVAGCDSIASLTLSTSASVPALPSSLTQTLLTNECGGRIYRYAVTAVNNAIGYKWIIPTSIAGIIGVTVDSGDINNSRIIKLKYNSNAAAGAFDSIKVSAFSYCGSSLYKGFKLSNIALNTPTAPSSITITAVSPYTCSSRVYRYSAPLLPAATSTTAAATGYIWSFTGALGANAVIDSGNINSRTIRVKFSNNNAATTGDSIRVLYTSGCGNSPNKSYKLTNTLLNVPSAPSSITTTLVSDVCGARVYRYSAPSLPIATTTTGAATGYLWTLSTGIVGSTGTIDSGNIYGRTIRVIYSSNAAATNSDSIKVKYLSDCGYSLNKTSLLTNVLKSPPSAPTSLTQTLVSDVCGSRVYRYSVAAVTNATGYSWTPPLSVGGVSGVAVDSGNINSDRIIKLRYISNAAAITTDSIKVNAYSGCGTSATKGFKLTNLAKTGCFAKETYIPYSNLSNNKKKKTTFKLNNEKKFLNIKKK